MQIFLDCDQVVANFDKKAEEILGMWPRDFEKAHGPKEFWKRLHDHGDFFGSLELMPDAMNLFNAVKHLNPIILTGSPYGNWAKGQKLAWRDKYFPGTEMIVVTPSRDKYKHMKQPGDILVDDMSKYQHIWEDNGGTFILHISAANSIKQLKDLNVI